MSGLKWKRAKVYRNGAADLLDDLKHQQGDAAARWIRQAEQAHSEARASHRRNTKSTKREHQRQGPVNTKAGLVIYTDGACEPNPGKGGWAFVAYREGEEVHFECGGEVDATNNTMEMCGVLKALEWVLSSDDRKFARILSDSQYVVKGCNEWRHSWKKRGWQRGSAQSPEPVKNCELWKRVDGLLMLAPVKIEWVKGHVGILGNERADELSNIGRKNAIEAALRLEMIREQLTPRA